MANLTIEMRITQLLDNHKEQTKELFEAIENYKVFIERFNAELDAIAMES